MADITLSQFEALTGAEGEVILTATTDTTSGVAYGVVDTDPTPPTNEQIRNGLNAASLPALGKGYVSVTSSALSVTITGLPSNTLLYGWLAQQVADNG